MLENQFKSGGKVANRLICIEGLDGVGKTTQAKLLLECFKSSGIDAISSREPGGGTPLGESIREFFINHSDQLSIKEQILLINTMRKHHLDHVVLPALKANKFVILDRFLYSTYTYQFILPAVEDFCNGNESDEAPDKFNQWIFTEAGIFNQWIFTEAGIHKDFCNNLLPSVLLELILPLDDIVKRLEAIHRDPLESRLLRILKYEHLIAKQENPLETKNYVEYADNTTSPMVFLTKIIRVLLLELAADDNKKLDWSIINAKHSLHNTHQTIVKTVCNTYPELQLKALTIQEISDILSKTKAK